MTTELSAESALRVNLTIIRQQRWWVIGAALLGLVLGVIVSFAQGRQYSATAQVLVQPAGIPLTLNGAQSQVTPADVQTEQQLMTSAGVRATVSRMLGSAPKVSSSQVGETNVIAVTATSRHPVMAARIANSYARAFVTYERGVALRNLSAAAGQLRSQISSLARQIRSLRSKTLSPRASALFNQEAVLKEQLAQLEVGGAVMTGSVELVTPATAPTSPSSPGPLQDGGLGLAAGLLLGLGAAFLRHNLNDALASKEAVEQLGGSPVVAMLPMVTSWKKRDRAVLVARSEPTSPAAEAYRSLRTSLQFARQERRLRSLVVTSPSPAEGKSCTAANLGTVFAQAGERVLLVSCDLRRPRIGQFFGLSEQSGLTTVLLGQQPLAAVLQSVPGLPNLSVLGAGTLPPNPAEVLNGNTARSLFADLSTQFDLVIIDSPPVLPVTDATLLATYTDATLLVVAAGQTKRGDLRRAAEKLAQINAPVLGIALNEVSKRAVYGYGYGYEYGYGNTPKAYQAEGLGVNIAPQGNGHMASPSGTDVR